MLTTEAWLSHLESRYPIRPVKLGLERIERVARALGVKTLPSIVITVGGTNGKGSTVAALEAIYLQAGYQVGVYTSPHLLYFNERIRLNGKAVSDKALIEAFSTVFEAEGALKFEEGAPKQALAGFGQSQILLTYFEFITLTALWMFKKNQLDLVILEVGLGGRLDATNMIDPDLAILTTIDFDHEAYLGHTREAIGYEKAGILRPQRPFIFASSSPPNSVLEKAFRLQTKTFLRGREYDFFLEDGYRFVSPQLQFTCPVTYLHPEAISAAIMASLILEDRLPVTQAVRFTAVSEVKLMGRLQVLPGKVEIVVDVAHNVQSARRLLAFLQAKYAGCIIRAVFSALADKAISQMVSILSPVVQEWHLACVEDKRAAGKEQLLAACSDYPSRRVLWYNSVFSAFIGAKTRSQTGEIVVVFGSFLTVSAVLKGEVTHEVGHE